MMDILGFRAMLEEMTPEAIARKVMGPIVDNSGAYFMGLQPKQLQRLTKEAISQGVEQPILTLMSDSLLTFWPVNDQSDLNELSYQMMSAGYFIVKAIQLQSENNIWLRGAISYGDVWIREEPYGLSYVGKPIAEAYQWEHNQNWIGGSLAPSAEEAWWHLATERDADIHNQSFFALYPAPLKVPGTRDRQVCLRLDEFTGFRDFAVFHAPDAKSTDPSAQEKYDNTRKFVEWLKANPRRILNGANSHT